MMGFDLGFLSEDLLRDLFFFCLTPFTLVSSDSVRFWFFGLAYTDGLITLSYYCSFSLSPFSSLTYVLSKGGFEAG